MAYFLGMDAGASTTFAVITDEFGNIKGIGKAGNGNHQINHKIAETNIHAATREALKNANLTVDKIDYAWFGLAGGDREVDFRILRGILDKLELPKYDVSGDTMIALRAGTLQSDGLVIICGSGVNCAGRNKQNEFYQCGGYGYMYGDFGGGGDLSVEVFRSVIRAWDGRGEETIMTPALLERLNFETVEEMYHSYLDSNETVRRDIAKILFPAAEKNDKVALDILKYQGTELGLSARSVIKHLAMEEDEFDIVLAGSIVTRSGNDVIQNIIEEYAMELAPKAKIKALTVEPVVGALLLAMEARGLSVTNDIYENLFEITDIGVK